MMTDVTVEANRIVMDELSPRYAAKVISSLADDLTFWIWDDNSLGRVMGLKERATGLIRAIVYLDESDIEVDDEWVIGS